MFTRNSEQNVCHVIKVFYFVYTNFLFEYVSDQWQKRWKYMYMEVFDSTERSEV